MPWEVHEWIASESKNDIRESETLKFLNSIMRKLIDGNFIEPDFSRINIGRTSLYISKGSMQVREKVDFVNLYVDSMSITKLLIDKHFIGTNSKINFVGISETMRFKEMILRRVIINSVSDIMYLGDINCSEIRIEAQRAFSIDDIALLVDTLKKHRIHVVLPYSLDRNIAKEILNVTREISSKNLSVAYDVCIILSGQFNAECTTGKTALTQEGIEHQSLRNAKISCGAGTNSFFIDKSGNIFSCYRLRDSAPIGNIFVDSRDAFIGDRKLAVSDLPKSCQLCDVKYLCANGCKCEQDNGTYIYCRHIKGILESALQK